MGAVDCRHRNRQSCGLSIRSLSAFRGKTIRRWNADEAERTLTPSSACTTLTIHLCSDTVMVFDHTNVLTSTQNLAISSHCYIFFTFGTRSGSQVAMFTGAGVGESRCSVWGFAFHILSSTPYAALTWIVCFLNQEFDLH